MSLQIELNYNEFPSEQSVELLLYCSTSDFYNNGGSNGGSVSSGPGPVGPGINPSSGGAAGPGGFGSYYQNDGGYSSPTGAPKPPIKKPPMHQNNKPQGPGVGQGGSFGQYGQGFGPKKNFGQAQGGGGGGGNFNYSTAYPSQVTGGQDYSYEGDENIELCCQKYKLRISVDSEFLKWGNWT